MSLTDRERDELLSKISKKIDSSSVLNGGFDNLVTIVESIKLKQVEQGTTLDNINTKLYEPKEGLFSRVQEIESNLGIVESKLVLQDGHVEKIKNIENSIIVNNAVTKRLERIAGEDLQDLHKSIELHKQITKLYWGVVALALTGAGNFIWQLITTHH